MSEEESIELNRWEQVYLLLFLAATAIGGLLKWFGFIP